MIRDFPKSAKTLGFMGYSHPFTLTAKQIDKARAA